MLILKADDVKKSLPFDQTIAAMKLAYEAFSSGMAEVPLRTQLNIEPYNGVSLFMPSFVQAENTPALVLKAVSVFPNNAARGIPTIHAAVLLFEAQTGEVLAMLEGSSLTAIRTGAASGAATDILAKNDAETLAIFGAGVQGRTQLQAVCSVRKIKEAWIYDLNAEQAHILAAELAGSGPVPEALKVAVNPKQAVQNADIICTATTSKRPVYDAKDVQPGTHINGIGSYTLEMIENPPALFEHTQPFVDSIDAVLAEAGEINQAVERKLLQPKNITELGKVILGEKSGRVSDHQVTYFKSVGIAVQDAMAASLALKNAKQLGLGQQVAW